ncbi:hypothetical protein BGZ73_000005 [Actinomortierella ambigua]|nr:hypothetical protein BGZ73_000005 [Actinomortierella ambigua]
MHGQGNYQDEKIYPSNGTTSSETPSAAADRTNSLDYSTLRFPSDGRPFPTAIFLDSGGVINNNDIRAPQWVHNLSNVMPPLFGGTPKHWGESNRRFSAKVFEVSYWNAFVARYNSFEEFDRAYNLLWLEMMAETADELLLQDRLTEWQKAGGIHPHPHGQQQEEQKTMKKGGEDDDKRAHTSTTAQPSSVPPHLKTVRQTIPAPTLAMAEQLFEKLTKLAKAGQSMAPKEDELAVITHVTLPDSIDDRVALAKALNDFCVGLVKADYPGAKEAILRMRTEQQLAVYTCSNEVSSDLRATFQAIDLLEPPACQGRGGGGGGKDGDRGSKGKGGEPVFSKLYGPDLVNQMKNGEAFYARIFEDCGVDPFLSVVVDDKELMLSWAKPLGVTTVQINKKRSSSPMMVQARGFDGQLHKVPAVDFRLDSLAELPDLLDAWKASLAKKQ